MNTILEYLPTIIAIVIAITFHEAAHGFIARAYGDMTATIMGRVTLNPIKHVDPIGTLLLPGILILTQAPFLFGYAKPVPVDFRQLKPFRLGGIMVAAAGPVMNFLLAFAAALLLKMGFFTSGFMVKMLVISVTVNVVLGVFNLLPIPPLDGGRIVTFLLPPRLAQPFARIEPFGFFILIGLFLLPSLISIDPLRSVMLPMVRFVTHAIMAISGLK